MRPIATRLVSVALVATITLPLVFGHHDEPHTHEHHPLPEHIVTTTSAVVQSTGVGSLTVTDWSSLI